MEERINEMSGAMNDGQQLQELRDRINAQAENLVKMGFTTGSKRRWIVYALLAVIVALLVAAEVYIYYVKDDFWGFNASLGTFAVTGIIADRILFMIMRRYLTRMKSADTATSHYRTVKQLIRVYKLRQWLPLTVALACSCLISHGKASWVAQLLTDSSIVLGVIIGLWLRNWNLDEDFSADVEELADIVEQESGI